MDKAEHTELSTGHTELYIGMKAWGKLGYQVHSPAHFRKGDLSKLTALVNFWFRTGTACIEFPVFPV
jgi:hypothetical protein